MPHNGSNLSCQPSTHSYYCCIYGHYEVLGFVCVRGVNGTGRGADGASRWMGGRAFFFLLRVICGVARHQPRPRAPDVRCAARAIKTVVVVKVARLMTITERSVMIPPYSASSREVWGKEKRRAGGVYVHFALRYIHLSVIYGGEATSSTKKHANL